MPITREYLEQQEYQTLTSYAVKNSESKGREFEEPQDKYRLDFQRDRDRIIHAKSYRRLKNKTQVFVPSNGDHYRNRLSHTLEVAQIARDIARSLQLNEDLAESIALAHDLGHTPFGHVGEKKLDELLKPYGLSFEHNLQSKRIVEKLEKKYPEFDGLNLTFETRDGLNKHRTAYDQPDIKNNKMPSMEAQVVNLADEIAYNAHDIDDGLRSGIIKINIIKKLEIWEIISHDISNSFSEDLFIQRAVSNLIGFMINDLYSETERRIEKNEIKTVEDVYNAKEIIVSFSEDLNKKNTELRKFLYENLYHHEDVMKHSDRGEKIIEEIFRKYMADSSLLPEKNRNLINKENPLPVVVKDYIAGMTDAFAEAEYEKLVRHNG